jgi:phosphatidylglycerophosphate synthase
MVVAALALNWFGDSLDGTLARVRNRQRPRYGYYVDHVIDLVGTAALLGGMSLSGYMNPLIGIGVLAAFALVEAEVFLATHVQQVFRLATFRVGPTELRIILAIGALFLLYRPWIYIAGKGPFLLFDVGGIVAIAGLLSAFIYSGIRNTKALYRAEPLKDRI